MLIFLILAIIVIFIVAKSYVIVPQAHAYVVERLGSYYAVWNNGIHFKIPFIDHIVGRYSLKEDVITLSPQNVITKDNVTMQIDAIMNFAVTDPKAAQYGVSDLMGALKKSVGTALRNVVGEIELDSVLSEREVINGKMQSYMDDVTDKWGVKVIHVAVKDVITPQDVKATMERQMISERNRRAQVTEAKGNKESQILNAEAQAETAQKEAEGQAQAEITAAKGKAQAMKEEAEGKAQAIKIVQQAYAESLKSLNDAGTEDSFLKLQAMDALTKVANGNATKLIVPSNLQDLTTLTDIIKKD